MQKFMNTITFKIKRFHKNRLLLKTGSGVVNLLLVLFVIWISTLLVDITFYLSESSRWLILVLNGCLSIFLFYKFIISPLLNYIIIKRSNNYTKITREIGEYFPKIADKLTNIYQIENSIHPKYSQSLQKYAISQFDKETRSIDFSSKLKFSDFTLPKHFIFFVYSASIFILILLHEPLSMSLKRILMPSKDFSDIPNYEFVVNPGNTTIIQGSPVKVDVKYLGPQINGCTIQFKTEKEPNWQKKSMTFHNNTFIYSIDNLKGPIDYFIKGEVSDRNSWSDKLISKNYHINTIIPPRLSDLQIKISPPNYTQLTGKYLDLNIGDIIAYAGSNINLSVAVNKPVKEANLLFSDGFMLPMIIREEKISAGFKVSKPGVYTISVLDKDNVSNQNVIEYTITVLEDYYPTVNIIEPEEEIEAIPDATINLQIEGNDDFGFSGTTLFYKVLNNQNEAEDTTYSNFNLPINISKTKYFLQNYLWDLSILPLGFDETLKYYVEVQDNDVIGGPKKSRSNFHYIHFPSLKQLFEDFASVEEENINDLEDLAQENEDVKKELEEIKRELKREKEIDWEKKREIESTLQKQKSINEKLSQIEKEIEKAIEKLADKNLFTPEILEKYRQLQELFQKMASPELMQSMEELQKSLENLDKKKVDQALNKMEINQKQFKENLERTLELFKKVQLEQELDRLVKMAKDLLDKQSEISEKLDKEPLNENEKDEIGKSQNEQVEDSDKIKKSMDNLLKDELFQSYQKAWQKMQEANEFAENQKLSKQMQNVQQQISSGNQKMAQTDSEELEKQLQILMDKLNQSQQDLNAQDKNRIMAKMRRSTDNLLRLSKDEEKLMSSTQKISNFSDQFREMAQNQQSVSENMNRVIKEIIDLSKETFFLSSNLSKSLGNSKGNMQSGLTALENRNKGKAGKHQKQAMASLNEAVMEMQNSMQSISQSKSGMGFEQFMKKMQQMAGQQGQLNEQGMNFMQGKGNSGKLSAAQQGALARMAAQQEALRKSLEQLNGEMSEQSDVLGDLDKIGEDMEKVVKELTAMKIDRKTIERQQKILSRMLDAQKSVREREYSHQRKAEVGKDYTRKRPSKLMDATDEERARLKRELKQALEEGYSADYEKLIEEYFRQLNKELEK